MGLLDSSSSERSTKAVEGRSYNAEYTYGPAGGITPSEMQDIKDGDYDRETGVKRCAFCRQPKPLLTGNGTTCDAYCERMEHGWVPWGKTHPHDRQDKGRGWLTLA
jgi:hypothetical protein